MPVWLFIPWIAAIPDAPFTAMTFDKAGAAARDRHVPILVYFTGPDNPQGRAYDELTWTDEKVRQWLNRRVVAIQVGCEAEADLCARFRVRRLPTILVVSPEGTVRARVSGFRDPDTLRAELEKKLQASDPVALARGRAEKRSGNPAALLTYAKTLAEAGRTSEAISRYLQCFDQEAGAAAGFGGVQLVIVDELGRLAGRSPRARKALLTLRDRSRDRILKRQERRTDAAVLAASNLWLGNLDETLSVYAKLQAERPDSLTARLLRECAVDSALRVKRYDRIAELIDVVKRARLAYEQFRRDRSRPLPPGTDPEKFRAFERSSFVERTVKYYEALVGTGRLDEADRVAAFALEGDCSADTYLALAQAGLRTGRPTAANAGQARRAVALSDPPDARAVSILVKVLVARNARDEAARVLEEYAPRLRNPQKPPGLKPLPQQNPAP